MVLYTDGITKAATHRVPARDRRISGVGGGFATRAPTVIGPML